MIKYADYIHLSTGFPTWNVANCINTGIYAAVDCEIRVVYKGTGLDTDRIAGFTHNEVGGGATDSTDFRLFYYTNGSLDVWNNRRSNLKTGGIVESGVSYDYTFGNYYCIDNLTQTTIYSGTTTSMNTNCPIRADVSSIYLNRLEIKNGGVVVFDGYAALDTSTNTVGLYDKVSQQMFTNGLSLTYDNLINTFIIYPESLSFNYDSGTTTVDITAEGGWTASTTDSWITLSDSTGTGDSTITITVPNNYNNNSDRVGTVDFTDGEEVLTLTVTQKADTRVILKNLYRSGTSIKQMYRSGVRIYQQVFRLIFNVDTDSITFDNTGGTYTINITANEKWTMTIPNWLNASSLSGTGNASIIISTNSVPESKLEGQIIINCENLTHTIDVEQKKAGTDLSTPLTFEILSDGYINWMVNGSTSYARTIQYSLNDGEWTSITSTSSGVHIQVLTGDEIKFRADNTNYSNGSSNFSTFMNGTATYNAKGNIMSMVDSTNYESNTTIPANYCFYRLFRNSKMVSAEDLLFPATTLKNYCYGSIFSNNTLLVTPPTILPATTLVEGCYQDFFAGCSSLTMAPELPAPTLVTRSYYAMFTNCTSLNYIKCLATNISASRCTEMWVNNITTPTGTFIKATGMNDWQIGSAAGIPSGWTVLDAS